MATITAQPYDFECPIDGLGLIVIDMQRDFIEPGGFGEALGNDVRPLGRIAPVVHELLESISTPRAAHHPYPGGPCARSLGLPAREAKTRGGATTDR